MSALEPVAVGVPETEPVVPADDTVGALDI